MTTVEETVATIIMAQLFETIMLMMLSIAAIAIAVAVSVISLTAPRRGLANNNHQAYKRWPHP